MSQPLLEKNYHHVTHRSKSDNENMVNTLFLMRALTGINELFHSK